MSENIENTKPIDVLATRVWSGTHWHYPHIETMIAELTRLRDEVERLKRENQSLAHDCQNIMTYVADERKKVATLTTRAERAEAERDAYQTEALAARAMMESAQIIDERFFFGANISKVLYEVWQSTRAKPSPDGPTDHTRG